MTDTSAEAVERLAAWHDNEARRWARDGGNVALARIHREHAATLRALRAERDGWQDTAARHLRNEEWLRGLLVEIGDRFGAAARTAADGSVYDSVLLLRVPELVAALVAERDAARGEAARLRDTASTSDDDDAITAEDEDRAFLGYSDEDDDDE